MEIAKEIFELIRKRRSIRRFDNTKDVPKDLVLKIIEAGSYAPSGHNNQPWRFSIVKNESIKDEISKLTVYGNIVKSANVLITVFLDYEHSYDRDKDLMAIGACIENMLLFISSLGLGAVWLGEILKNKDKVRELLKVDGKKELVAIIALGYPMHTPKSPGRKPVEELIVNEY
jgi:nitroreductase